MRGSWLQLCPSLPLIVALAAAVRPLLAQLPLLNDPDTYLHVGVGQWIIANLTLPTHDPFSHSMSGAHWSVPEWLAEVVLASAYDLAGWIGIVLLTVACYATAIAIFARYLLRYIEPLPAIIAIAASVAVTLPHLLARPHILALPLLVLWCAAIIAARDAGRRPHLFLLGCMVLWANLHASFAFGLAVAIYLTIEAVLWPGAEGRRREAIGWSTFTLLAIVAAMITPHGVLGLAEPFHLMGMGTLQSSFVEWQSPNFQEFQPLEFWLLGAVALGFSCGFKIPVSRLLLLVGLLHMALVHGRHADLVGLVLPLAVAASLGPQIAAKVRSDPPSALAQALARLALPVTRAGAVAAALIALLLCAPLLLRGVKGPEDSVTPAYALAEAQRLGLAGPVFNSEGFGGYLVFRGIKTYIDGRIEMYGDAFLRNYIVAQSGNGEDLKTLLNANHIAWTLLRPGEGAVGLLDHLAGWHRIYADPYAVIHVRDPASSD